MRGARSLLRLLFLVLALAIAAFALLNRVPPPTAVPPPLTGQIDRILVEKAARRMTAFQNGRAVRTYDVALGFAPKGDKEREGDGKTPEGLFRIDRRNGQSRFHLSLGLDYPLPEDRARARAAGYAPGGDIMIHGQPNALAGMAALKGDWTAGCIALTNAEMGEIWRATPIGTPVEIRP